MMLEHADKPAAVDDDSQGEQPDTTARLRLIADAARRLRERQPPRFSVVSRHTVTHHRGLEIALELRNRLGGVVLRLSDAEPMTILGSQLGRRGRERAIQRTLRQVAMRAAVIDSVEDLPDVGDVGGDPS